jgi:hypothetical protein
MSVNVTTAFVNQYKDQQQQLLQQHGTRLRQTVMNDHFHGKGAKAIEQVGALTAQRLTVRHGDTPQMDTPHSARWIFPTDWVVNDFVDDQDKLRMLIDPQSIYAKNHRDALGRAIDDTIIEAALGTAYVGENGTTSEAFDTTNWSIASGSVGLTIAKLRTAKRMLMAAENDMEEQYTCVLSADQVEDLLGETLLVSIDYNTVKPLAEGRVVSFMGFNFVHSERILSVSSEDAVMCYPKSGLLFGTWNDIEIRIDERPDKNYTTQVYGRASIGATRTHEAGATTAGKLVRVLCTP